MPAKKGMNMLERGSQVHFMSEFMAILDFPPAPKLDIYGELNAKAAPSEAKGQTLLTGKARCATCNPAPYYTDNSMHNLKAERFYKQTPAGGMMRSHDGPITTFPSAVSRRRIERATGRRTYESPDHKCRQFRRL
jgi:cytochrome c peroxidase